MVTKLSSHQQNAINKAGCPAGRVMGLDEVFADPQVLAQDMVLDSRRDGRETIRMTGFPVKLSDTPATLQRPPPELGEHTDEIVERVRNRTNPR